MFKVSLYAPHEWGFHVLRHDTQGYLLSSGAARALETEVKWVKKGPPGWEGLLPKSGNWSFYGILTDPSKPEKYLFSLNVSNETMQYFIVLVGNVSRRPWGGGGNFIPFTSPGWVTYYVPIVTPLMSVLASYSFGIEKPSYTALVRPRFWSGQSWCHQGSKGTNFPNIVPFRRKLRISSALF